MPSESLAARLTAQRLERGLTQAELAAATGTTQAAIQKIENGKSLRPRNLEDLARILETSPSWQMFGVGGPRPLEDEAYEVASAWAELPEPHRSAVKEVIAKISAGLRAGSHH